MKKLLKCFLCGEKIKRKDDLFILKEDIKDWNNTIFITKIIKAGSTVCRECLIDYIENTERVLRTTPQIEYRYINITDN